MLDRRAEACYQGYVASVRVWADCTWGGSDGQRFEPPEVVERHRRNIAPMYDQYVEARIKAWMAR
jgi:hypothetical protein